jgi:hypothetical protein
MRTPGVGTPAGNVNASVAVIGKRRIFIGATSAILLIKGAGRPARRP